MAVPVNTFKAALREGRAQIGLWQGLANPYTAEICAGAGFDWLVFDGEHAPNDLPVLLAQLQAVTGYSVHPVARPPTGDAVLIKQYLDIGFTSLLVPLVETPEQAAHLVRAVRYPPEGIRGVANAVVRASRWNRIPDYLDAANEQVCLLVQVETRKGLENLEAISRTEGVDGIFIGPADLSASLGYRGNPSHPEMQATIERAIGTICRIGKAAGILMGDEALARRYLYLGCTFVAVGTDVGLLARGASDLAERYKSGATSNAPAKGSVY